MIYSGSGDKVYPVHRLISGSGVWKQRELNFSTLSCWRDRKSVYTERKGPGFEFGDSSHVNVRELDV
jgi:hypothetical protein